MRQIVSKITLSPDFCSRNKIPFFCLQLYFRLASDYVKSLTDHPTLQDKLSHKNYETESTKVAIYPPHLTPSQIHQGIKDGLLHQGSFAASRENYLEGSVNVEGYEKFVRT